jgi:hypothetical protein
MDDVHLELNDCKQFLIRIHILIFGGNSIFLSLKLKPVSTDISFKRMNFFSNLKETIIDLEIKVCKSKLN